MRNGIKGFVIAFVMICMAGVVMPEMTAKAAVEGNYEYEEREDGSVWITKYTGKETKVVIPSQLGSKNVTGIADQAFVVWVEVKPGFYEDASTVTEVVFPDTLTYIGNWNFYQLTSIHIPANVTSIGSRAFGTGHVESITVDAANTVYKGINNAIITERVDEETGANIVELVRACNKTVIPDGVTHIGSDAFFDYSLPGIIIPDSVKEIGYCAFSGCDQLTSISIPASVTTIGMCAFYGCDNLKSVELKEGLIEIWSDAFHDCDKLTEITIPKSVTLIEGEAFAGCDNLQKVVLQEGLKEIGGSAFENCEKLCDITIPKTVITIGERAFGGNNSIDTITVPENVVIIGYGAFAGCGGIVIDSNNKVYDSRDNCNAVIVKDYNEEWFENFMVENYPDWELENPVKGELIAGCRNTNIPSGVTRIGDRAFAGCSGLTDIFIPEGVGFIGEFVFTECSNLSSIRVAAENTIYYSSGNCLVEKESKILVVACKDSVIPDDIKGIGVGVFSGRSDLRNVIIPESVTDISDCAFEGCSNLTSITIPSSVSYIGEDAFAGCLNMTAYVEPGSYAEEWAQEYDCATGVYLSGEKCIVKILSSDASNPTVEYAGTTDESATTIKVPDAVTINRVVYKVVGIADHAFSGNKNITKVDIGKNVAAIGEKAFSDCPSLGEVVLPEALETVSPDVFEGTVEADSEKDLKVTIPEGAEDVSKAGIEKIINIQYVTIYVPEGSKTEIYLKQFEYLVIITYPPTQPSTGNKENEQKGETVKTTEQVTETPKEQPEIGKKYTVNNLTYKVTSSKYVTFVGTSKKSLKTLTIPAKVTILGQSLEVTAIEKRAMKKCSKLTTVVVGSNVKTIGDEAFMNCSHLKKITIGKNVKTIGKKAFYGDKKVTRITFKGAKLSKIGKKALSKVPKKVKIKAPKKAKKKYTKMLNCTK